MKYAHIAWADSVDYVDSARTTGNAGGSDLDSEMVYAAATDALSDNLLDSAELRATVADTVKYLTIGSTDTTGIKTMFSNNPGLFITTPTDSNENGEYIVPMDSVLSPDTNAAGLLNVNFVTIQGDTGTVTNIAHDYNGTGYSKTTSVVGLVNTVGDFANGAIDSLGISDDAWLKLYARSLAAVAAHDGSYVIADSTGRGRPVASYDFNYPGNLIINPSFEHGSADSSFESWTAANGALATVFLTRQYPHTGIFGARFYRASKGADSAMLSSSRFYADSGRYEWGAFVTNYAAGTDKFRLILLDTAGTGYDTLDLGVSHQFIRDTIDLASNVYYVRIDGRSGADANLDASVDDIVFARLSATGTEVWSSTQRDSMLAAVETDNMARKADSTAFQAKDFAVAGDSMHIYQDDTLLYVQAVDTVREDFAVAGDSMHIYQNDTLLYVQAVDTARNATDYAVAGDSMHIYQDDTLLYVQAVDTARNATGASGASVSNIKSLMIDTINVARDDTKDDYKASISGSGSDTLTLWMIDTSGTDEALARVSIIVHDSASGAWSAGTVLSNASGYYKFALDSSTYLVLANAIGYEFPTPQYINVDGATTDSILGYDLAAGTPSSAGLCRVEGWIYNLDGSAAKGKKVSFQFEGTFNDSLFNGDVQIIPGNVWTTTDSTGYWYKDLYPNSTLDSNSMYRYSVDGKEWVPFEVPNAATVKIGTLISE